MMSSWCCPGNSAFVSSFYNRFTLKSLTFLLSIFLLLIAVVPLKAEEAPLRYPILGVHGGYNYVGGYYQDNLTDGASAGIFCIPWMWSFIMIDTDLTWSYINVESSPDSYFMSVALTVGPLFRWSPFKRLDLFAGVIMRGSYFHFYGSNSGVRANSIRVGFGVSAGAFINIYKNVDLRITYRFSENDLSTRTFMSHEVLGGVSYAFAIRRPVSAGNQQVFYEKVKAEYERGRELYLEGKFSDALDAFREVRKLDPEHREAGEYIILITASLDIYEKADRLERKGDLFGAIKMLKQADPRMTEARIKIESLRKKLARQVRRLEREMINQYNQKKYLLCIGTGEKILLVEPKNRKAPLYIQRARRRYNALRKFR